MRSRTYYFKNSQSIINQCLFVGNNPKDFLSDKGFLQSHRVNTCKLYICNIHLCPSARSIPCMHHASCKARRSPTRCQWGTHRPDGSSNLAPTNHTTSDTSQRIKHIVLHCHPSNRNRSQELDVQGYHLYKASVGVNVRLDVDLEPDLVDLVFLMLDSAFSPYLQPLLILH